MKYIILAISALLLPSCTLIEAPERPDGKAENLRATVQLRPLDDSRVSGNFLFEEEDGEVHVTGIVSGLEPNSTRAFHIHEKGDCGNRGENAGEHFNPLKAPHGKFGELPHHAGDFPQLEADENGMAEVDFSAETIRLSEDETNIIGRALIVHRSEDKYTQPSGDAGARIACGIIVKKS